jgi:hypothetical protein
VDPSPAGSGAASPPPAPAIMGRVSAESAKASTTDLLATDLEIATATDTSVIITGTTLQIRLVDLTTLTVVPGHSRLPRSHPRSPGTRTPATHCDHDRSAQMLNYPARPHPSTAQLSRKRQLTVLI